MDITRNGHYIDNAGLSKLWSKIKAIFNEKQDRFGVVSCNMLATSSSRKYIKIWEQKSSVSDGVISGYVDFYPYRENASSGGTEYSPIGRLFYMFETSSSGIFSVERFESTTADDIQFALCYGDGTNKTVQLYAIVEHVHRITFETHQQLDTDRLTYDKITTPVYSLPSDIGIRYAVKTNIYMPYSEIGANMLGTIYGIACEFVISTAEESTISMRINTRQVVHNLTIMASSSSLSLIDTAYGNDVSDNEVFGYIDTTTSPDHRVTIYLKMTNYRYGASVTDFVIPNHYRRNGRIRDIEFHHGLYVGELPEGAIKAVQGGWSKYDEEGEVIKETYMRVGSKSTLTITDSNWTQYMTASNGSSSFSQCDILTIDGSYSTVFFDTTSIANIAIVEGINENGHRITIAGKWKPQENGGYMGSTAEGRFSSYIYTYRGGVANRYESDIIQSTFEEFIYFNGVWYSKGY